MVIDSKYSNSNFARSLKKEHAFELDIKLPYEALREINLDVNYNSVGQNALGSKLSLDVNQDKVRAQNNVFMVGFEIESEIWNFACIVHYSL